MGRMDFIVRPSTFFFHHVSLMAFVCSSLVTETIPRHRDFKVFVLREKLSFKKVSLLCIFYAAIWEGKSFLLPSLISTFWLLKFFVQKVLKVLSELEALKPVVQQKIEELNRKHTSQVDRRDHFHQNGSFDSSLEWPCVKKKTPAKYEIQKV